MVRKVDKVLETIYSYVIMDSVKLLIRIGRRRLNYVRNEKRVFHRNTDC